MLLSCIGYAALTASMMLDWALEVLLLLCWIVTEALAGTTLLGANQGVFIHMWKPKIHIQWICQVAAWVEFRLFKDSVSGLSSSN